MIEEREIDAFVPGDLFIGSVALWIMLDSSPPTTIMLYHFSGVPIEVRRSTCNNIANSWWREIMVRP